MIKFTNIDKKFEQIGFNKIKENEYTVVYEKKNIEANYCKKVVLTNQTTGMHIVESYGTDLHDKIINSRMCLSMYEMKLCIKKMKQKEWRIRKKVKAFFYNEDDLD